MTLFRDNVIKPELKKRQWTPEQLAKFCNMPTSEILSIMEGQTPSESAMLYIIVKLYGLGMKGDE